MKVGIDIRVFIASRLTGVGIYAWEILKHLFEHDQENQYKLFYSSARFSRIKALTEFEKYENVRLYNYRVSNKFLNFSWKFFNKPKIDKLVGGCDVFWFPNLNFWSVSQVCKLVVTVHDLSFERIPWAYSGKMRWWHKAVNPKKKLLSADKIIAVSENTKRDIIDLYNIAGDKIEVVYSGVGNSEFGIRNSELGIRNKYDLPDKFILYLGTLEPRKNVEGVIQAFELLDKPEYHLIIAGGKGWLYKKIYQLVSQSKFKNNIRLINYIQPDDRFGLYQSASLFVWPSFYEGFGFPPLEAMSQGCPVITSANSSLPEVVQDSAILVDPYNIKEISQAMKTVLEDQSLRAKLVERGYNQVKKYNWHRSAERMLEVFNRIIE